MKKMLSRIEPIIFTLSLVTIPLFSQSDQANPADKLQQFKSEVRANLTGNILPLWMNEMVDPDGGFYSDMDADNRIDKHASRGGIQNARILWTFSAVFNALGDSLYQNTATNARDYILENFLDNEYGGAYMSLTAEGKPLDTRKHIYTQSFFIYGLAEYYRATGDQESLEEAIKIFNLTEKFAFDESQNGYFEFFSRDWQRTTAEILGNEGEDGTKGMNTHIHLLEAYTNLYRAWPDQHLENQLNNLIELFCDKFIDEDNFHLVIYFNDRWETTKTFYSYGHDIELSWLIVEAAHVLGDEQLLEKVNGICIKMVEATLEGLQPDGSMVYEKDPVTGHVNTLRSYWTQAEAIVGLINAYQITGKKSYLHDAINCWDYTEKHMIDHEKGEWYSSIRETGSEKYRGDKAGFWKAPYHHGRMCMEVMSRLNNID